MSESIQPFLWCVEISDNRGNQDPMLSDLNKNINISKTNFIYLHVYSYVSLKFLAPNQADSTSKGALGSSFILY